MWFKCKHPFEYLVTEKEQTVTAVDADFENVEYHFVCKKCGEHLTKKHSRLIGGVSAFMERGRKQLT